MLKAHSGVTKLMGIDPMTKYKIAVAVFLQVLSLELLQGAPWYTWVFCCYTLAGAINGSMTLAMHELSHNLGARRPILNRFLAIFANLPMGLPAAATFRRYHLEHHKFMGEDKVDVDIPSTFEGFVFYDVWWKKAIWLFFQPAWYSLRPLFISPKNVSGWELFNYVCTISFDAMIFSRYGVGGIAYLALGTICGMQFHPIAGHFVAEHFVMKDEQETYSYYGPLNWLTYNVGYHNEHHDFPFISSRNLPVLRKMAAEFYDTIPHYHSWVKVLWDFIVDPKLTPFSRIKRNLMSDSELEALKAKGGLVP